MIVHIYYSLYKGSLLLSGEISLKVVCEKIKFSNCVFCNNLHDYEETYMKIIQNILNDVETNGNGGGGNYGLI